MRSDCLITVLVCVVSAGCSEQSGPPPPDYSTQAANVKEALDTRFADAESIAFRSWNGKWIGMDCDTDVTLNADGTAVVTEYGYAVREYSGTYSVANSTELSLVLRDYDSWPTMYVIPEDSDLLLMPTDSSGGFVMGNRAGATLPGGAGSFWPFRQLSEDVDDAEGDQQ